MISENSARNLCQKNPTLKKDFLTQYFKDDIIANEQIFLVTVVIKDSKNSVRSIFDGVKWICFTEKPTHQVRITLLYPHFY